MKNYLLCFLFLVSIKSFAQNCDQTVRQAQRVQIFQPQLKGELLYIVHLWTHRRAALFLHSHWNSTAAFIHPRVLVTAGHNLYNKRTNVVDVVLKVGSTHKDSFLVSQSMKTKMYKNIYVLPSYNKNPTFAEDIGIIILPDSTLYRKAQGHFNITSYSSNTRGPVHFAGYPEPNKGIKFWSDKTSNFAVVDGALEYDFYTEQGASGSAIYTDKFEVIAVHTKGALKPDDCNSATIITPRILQEIKKWCMQHNILLGD